MTQSQSATMTCSQILVTIPGVVKPFKARIVQLGVECELALLRVDDSAAFWRHVLPLELGALPNVQDLVQVRTSVDHTYQVWTACRHRKGGVCLHLCWWTGGHLIDTRCPTCPLTQLH